MSGPAPIVEEAIKRIGELYDIEALIRGAPLERRREIRQKQTAPRFKSLRDWLETTRAQLPQKSKTAETIRYALTRWTVLGRFIDDGAIEIDDNSAERAIRPITSGARTGSSPVQTGAANAPLANCR